MELNNIVQAKQSALTFFVNGNKVVEENPNAEWTLVYYLRNTLRLCGTKEGCGEGGCGACTVMLSKIDTTSNKIINLAINACLTPLCSVHGTAIVTTEGIGSIRDGLHPVQERIAKSHGTQCGYCTPGFVMSMYTLLRNNNSPAENVMENAFQGNLCRCTGYRPIIEAFKTFCQRRSPENGCCANGNGPTNSICCKERDGFQHKEVSDILFEESEFKPYDPTQDPIFPPQLLQVKEDETKKLIVFGGGKVTWYIAKTKTQLLELKDEFPDAKIIAGNTEIGVEVKFKNHFYEKYIQITAIPELCQIQLKENHLIVGGSVTLTNLKEFCSTQTTRVGDIFFAISEILNWFGGQQIRNVATVAGNVVTASPISDLNPIFMASGSSVTFASKDMTRTVKMDKHFFTSYRQTVMKSNEIVESVTIPLTVKDEYIWATKVSRRKEDDIAIVNCCMRAKMFPDSDVVKDGDLAYGGMGQTTLLSSEAAKYLSGKKWKEDLVNEVNEILLREFELQEDSPGGMTAYRLSLVVNLFYKFHLTITHWLILNNNSLDIQREMSAIESRAERKTKSSQLYEIVPKDQTTIDLIGRPLTHMSALRHATGEAVYTDDSRPISGELCGAFVVSKIAHGNIINIDPADALNVPGVVDFIDWRSLKSEKNRFGVLLPDEEVFASKQITCQGQVIGFVVAVDQFTAEKSAHLVKVECEELELILTIEDAVKHNSFLGVERQVKCGNAEEAFLLCDHVIEGEMRIGGQEHFYLETQSCLVTPKEDDEIDILLPTQAPNYIQITVAKCLDLPANRVRVRCKRMGGAFGGKETRSAILALATSVAARKLGVAVRCVMDRSVDMNVTGGRHPFLCQYKVGFKNSGEILAIQAKLYSNGGNTVDASTMVMEKALLSIDAAYKIPNWDLRGRACKTNLPSNTAFRGFGGPQASLFLENMLDLVAETLHMDPFQIRMTHLKKDGDCTPYGFLMENCTLSRCWSELTLTSNYGERKENVKTFNKENKWKKRGIVVVPTKHDIGFHEGFLNQGAALVLIYSDGSVSLNHGGTEMGQGLLTKMSQVASRALNIPIEKIHFSETSTDKIPNATGTCASMSSDLNGPAVINACNELLERLKPFKEANPSGKWEDWVLAAYLNKVSLSATGFYQLDLDYKFGAECTGGQKAFSYASFGVACSEVEVDCLTGEHQVLRTDIVMDVGESLNPAVDIGQIEGAFIQGYGLFTMEELLYSPKGVMITKGPGNYKIPAMGDIPREFHVSLLRGAPNPRAVYSSKAIGEPPLFLAASIYFAIKEAVKEFRLENGLCSTFTINSPATVERILDACQVKMTENQNLNIQSKWSIVV